MSNTGKLDEDTLKRVVSQVLGQLGAPTPTEAGSVPQSRGGPRSKPESTPITKDCGCPPGGGADGAFTCACEAAEAAGQAYLKLTEAGMEARRKVVDIVKTLCRSHAGPWGRLELEETRIGRLDHKVEKLDIVQHVPGVEWLRPLGMSGDHGITMEEQAPFGVVVAITPSTHSIPTLSGNIINAVAAGNTLVINPHPGAARCAVEAVKTFNRAILRETGIANIVTIVKEPTLETFDALASSEHVNLLCITGGPAVVQAALRSGKRAICAGPGNPPVIVDETADLASAAEKIVRGASYDNNLLCIGEKEIFVLDSIADRLMSELENAGATRIDDSQLEALTGAAFTEKRDEAGGCARPVLQRDLIGKDPTELAKAAGATLRQGSPLLFAETRGDHPFVMEEQMMPFLPVVRVPTFEAAVEGAKKAEHGYQHSAIIHSRNVDHMTAMARALKPTLFVKNGACVAGLGIGGEGYLSYSIATTTGEGITNPSTFTRVRRCVMVDNLKIY